MQIKILRFLLCLSLVFIANVSYAGISDWFMENCKQIENVDGQSLRTKDIKSNELFKNARFYKGLCSDKKAPTGNSYCIKMTDIQLLSMTQAVQIAKDYAKEQYNDVVTCYPAYFGCKDNDDHVLCSNADNSAHYEFVFNDITEKSSFKYRKGIATAYCKMIFGEDIYIDNPGKIWEEFDRLVCWKNRNDYDKYSVAQGDVISDKATRDAAQPQADKLNKLLKVYGFSARNNGNNFPIYFESKNCRNDGVNELKTYKGIKNERFQKQQMILNTDITAWLSGYVANNLPEKLESFKCDSSPKTCYTGDTFNPLDDYLTCYVNGDNPIDFRFDDLSEPRSNRQKSATDVMKCMSQGGEWDSESCRGFSQCDCDGTGANCENKNSLKVQTNGAAHWDSTFETCVLDDAAFITKLQRGEEITVVLGGSVVVLVGAALSTPESGGTSFVAAFGFISAAVGSLLLADREDKKTVIRGKVKQFTTDLEKCINNNDNKCIHSKINEFFNGFSTYLDIVEYDQAVTVEEYLSKGIQKLLEDPEEQNKMIESIEKERQKGYIDKYLSAQTPEDAKAYAIEGIAAMISDFIPISIGAVTKIGNITKFEKTGKTLKVLKTIRKTGKTVESIQKMLDILTLTK